MVENFESLDVVAKNPENGEVESINYSSVLLDNWRDLKDLRKDTKAKYFEMGDCFEIKENDKKSYSALGVFQAVAGIIHTNENKTYLFESFLDTLSDQQQEIIDKAVGGTIGGGRTALKSIAHKFEGKNIDIVHPSDRLHDFNFVVIQDKRNPDEAPVLCYRHESVENLRFQAFKNICKAIGAQALIPCMDETESN